ncbi:hypothetical protein MFLAVUS_002719 [Mucor flavus]|uniref:Uncharacterized protein n=1 Tax=Mucor flavus TaxID=439312 RepID=A0ABP9YR36_9FUNG
MSFSEEELQEIKGNPTLKATTPIPKELRDCINSYNCTFTQKIRRNLAKRPLWEVERIDDSSEQIDYGISKYHDFGWVKLTMHSLLREYECGSLNSPKKELWYNIHI